MKQAPSWPPTTVREWARGGAVSSDLLVEELRAWLDYFGDDRPRKAIPMSVDVTVDADCCGYHGHNFTYNYSPALREAGFPAWKYLHGLQADIVAILLGRLLLELPGRRTQLEPLIKGGGTWGTWESMNESLKALLADCDKHPSGQVSICG